MVEAKEEAKVVSTEEACEGKEKPCEAGNAAHDSGK